MFTRFVGLHDLPQAPKYDRPGINHLACLAFRLAFITPEKTRFAYNRLAGVYPSHISLAS